MTEVTYCYRTLVDTAFNINAFIYDQHIKKCIHRWQKTKTSTPSPYHQELKIHVTFIIHKARAQPWMPYGTIPSLPVRKCIVHYYTYDVSCTYSAAMHNKSVILTWTAAGMMSDTSEADDKVDMPTLFVNNSRPPLVLRLTASPLLAVQRRLNHASIKFIAV